MEKLQLSTYVIVSKNNCIQCEMVKDLLNDYFIEYTIIKAEDLTAGQLTEIKPKDAKTYPFVFKNKEYIGGFNELRKLLTTT